MAARYVENFGECAFGDQRLTRRALSIGQALSDGFGQALSMVFESGKELKRAYEFSPMPRPVLKRSLPLIVR